MNAISEQVIKIIAEQMCTKEIKPEMTFRDDLDCDSLDEVEIVMGLEEEFAIEIADEQAEKIKTVQQAIDYVEAKLAKINCLPVQSSQMEAIGHSGRTLAICFKGNNVYHYPGVTAEEFEAFKTAESLGSHFSKQIKPRPLYFKVEA